jgi:hypothetical protein
MIADVGLRMSDVGAIQPGDDLGSRMNVVRAGSPAFREPMLEK